MLGLALKKISSTQKWSICSMSNLNLLVFHIYYIIIFFTILKPNLSYATTKYTKEDILKLREEVREMFNHAYSGYLKYAYPYDELRPLTCDGVDTWGSYSLTLIDALDTLAVMGNYSEFRRVVDIVTSKANFDANINVSVFETNIRIVGGLLSAHLLSQRAGVELEPGWPCNGPLLRLAEDVAKRLIAAFDTMTGMPYGTVNLRHGVPLGETSITCTAGVGTYILEFGTLTRLTGDPLYEEVALNALYALYHHRSSIGLYGNHIDVMTGRWTAQDSGIGAGVDSYLEYLVKGALLVQRPELMAIFNEGRAAIDKYLRRNDWYLWVSMFKGQVTLPVFQSLEAYWPGILSLIGDISSGMKSMHNYHQVWKQYGFTPEFYNIAQGQAGTNRESYPLRPELVESTMYLYRATGDPFLLDVGRDILRSIQHSARTKCGYATIKDCRDHTLENRMESFFLAETTKYLYLLFDPDNFIHNNGQQGTVHTLPSGQECVLDAGGYIFNTEAHPLDPGALLCCSENFDEPIRYNHKTARGEKLTSFVKKEQEEQLQNVDKISSTMDTEQEDATSVFTAEEKHSTNEEDEFLEKLQESGAVDVVKLPPPSSEEVHSLHSEFNNNKISLHTLEMIEIVIDSQLENYLLNRARSQDLLREMINVIESAENSLQIRENDNEALKETFGETPHNNNNVGDVKSENASITNETNTHNYNELNNNIPLSKELVEENHSAESSDNSDSTGNSSKPGGRRRKSLFEQVIVQHFKTIKDTVITEADLIDFHVKKCTEILEFTKNLVNTSDGEKIATEFFTRRLDVMITASEIKKSLVATKKLLLSQGIGEGVTLEFLKTLVESIVDGRTLEDFLGKYKNYIEVVRKLITIRKEGLQKEAMEVETNVDENLPTEGDANDVEDERKYSKEDSEVFQDNWKADDISYQVDDREKVVPVSKIDNGPLFTDKLKFKTETVVGSLPKVLLPSETPFNPQVLLERIRADPKYPRNATWTTQYDLLTCSPQPYFTRLMLSGEFFSD